MGTEGDTQPGRAERSRRLGRRVADRHHRSLCSLARGCDCVESSATLANRQPLLAAAAAAAAVAAAVAVVAAAAGAVDGDDDGGSVAAWHAA